jgi:hypothetical protein
MEKDISFILATKIKYVVFDNPYLIYVHWKPGISTAGMASNNKRLGNGSSHGTPIGKRVNPVCRHILGLSL